MQLELCEEMGEKEEMIKIENVDVFGWESAIRGMRNAMNSWDKSDSCFCYDEPCCEAACIMHIGENDLKLMQSLVKAGSDHSKFMRMINVTCDITAPLYWWKEFDTYKVGTVRNSCSTMHKLTEKEFTLDDFSWEHLDRFKEYDEQFDEEREYDFRVFLNMTKNQLNWLRKKYLETKNKPMKNEHDREKLMKKYWWQMIQLLPSSYNQRATVQLNYAVLRNMYHARKNHKLDEWRDFCKWVETLPYAKELICCE